VASSLLDTPWYERASKLQTTRRSSVPRLDLGAMDDTATVLLQLMSECIGNERGPESRKVARTGKPVAVKHVIVNELQVAPALLPQSKRTRGTHVLQSFVMVQINDMQ